MAKFETIIKDALSGLGISENDPRVGLLVSHYNQLLRYNKAINLTSLTKPEQIAYRLFTDSLIPLSYLTSEAITKSKPLKILDIGSGGGFPSIPLRIFTPEAFSFVLIEKRKKAVFFLEELILNLSLSNIKVVQGRVETLGSDPEYAENFDFVLNKASFPRDEFLSVARMFIKPDGKALLWTKYPPLRKDVPKGWEQETEIISPEEWGRHFRGMVVIFRIKNF